MSRLSTGVRQRSSKARFRRSLSEHRLSLYSGSCDCLHITNGLFEVSFIIVLIDVVKYLLNIRNLTYVEKPCDFVYLCLEKTIHTYLLMILSRRAWIYLFSFREIGLCNYVTALTFYLIKCIILRVIMTHSFGRVINSDGKHRLTSDVIWRPQN